MIPWIYVTSSPCALDIDYMGGDVETYAQWLQRLENWLKEMLRVSMADGERLGAPAVSCRPATRATTWTHSERLRRLTARSQR
jgi:hypothetical protein